MFNDVKRAILNAVANLEGYVDIAIRGNHIWVGCEYIDIAYTLEEDGTSEFKVMTDSNHGGYKHGEDVWPLEKIVDCLNAAVKLANEVRDNVED